MPEPSASARSSSAGAWRARIWIARLADIRKSRRSGRKVEVLDILPFVEPGLHLGDAASRPMSGLSAPCLFRSSSISRICTSLRASCPLATAGSKRSFSEVSIADHDLYTLIRSIWSSARSTRFQTSPPPRRTRLCELRKGVRVVCRSTLTTASAASPPAASQCSVCDPYVH